MVEYFRKQLDEWLGADRDELPEERTSFKDPINCRYFLCGMCPHDVLAKTKSDLGPCKYVHSLPARAAYEEAAKTLDFGYKDLLIRKLYSILAECDRRAEIHQKRIEQDEREMMEKDPFEKEIRDLQDKHERALEEGALDEAAAISEELKNVRIRREQAREEQPQDEAGRIIQQLGGGANQPQYQALRVCEICASLLSARETKRLEDHFYGKLHLAFQEVRNKLNELLKSQTNLPRAPEYETELPELPRSSEIPNTRSSRSDYDRGYRHRDNKYNDHDRRYRNDPYGGRSRLDHRDLDYERDRRRYDLSRR